MTRRSRQSTRTELIVECWDKLNAEVVGRRELEAIGDLLRTKFGPSAPSPALIARTLADHGVPLSHPEVLDTDTTWREHQLLEMGDLETIDAAFIAIERIRAVAGNVEANRGDRLRLQVRQLQEELELFAKSQIGSTANRTVVVELASWLSVWLQTPSIFDDWLSLRRNSPEFLQKFG